MAVRPLDTIEAAGGMATDFPPADCPRNRCQLAVGFTPARRGRMDLAPLLKRIQKKFGLTIHAHAVWLSQAGEGDRLLIFSGTTVYSYLLYNAWHYDERLDGQHSYYSIGSLTTVGTVGGSAASGFECVQFHTELILSVAGLLYRYYVETDGIGSERLYGLGLGVFNAAPTLAASTGGALTLLQTYEYEITLSDELFREGSPSAAGTITLTGSNDKVSVTQAGGYVSGRGQTYWNIYRKNPGATLFKFVVQLPLGTTAYDDVASDSTVNLGASAPLPGQNDPPGVLGPAFAPLSNIMCVTGNGRLVLNDLNAPNMYQISNALSPVQFSSLPLPTNLTDGLRANIAGKGQNEVTGMASLGSLLSIFGRETTNLLYGDDISNFTLRQTLERGCQNPKSVQRCDNVILFLSDDGIYSIGYEDGYTDKKVSLEIDDIFRGFQATAQIGSPTATGRQASIQVASAIFGNVNSFYSEQRYYISLGNRTLCYDLQTGGWTDTGWGFVKTATRYLSQMANLTGSAPETVFITTGDLNTFSTDLQYFTVADTALDVDAPGSVKSRIVMRPFDASGSMQQRSKRPCALAQYGSTKAPPGSVIGTIRWWGDGDLMYESPIYAHLTLTNEYRKALFEVRPPMFEAACPWIEMEFTVNDLRLERTLIEMAFVS